MAHILIEATSLALLEPFKQTLDYQELVSGARAVTQGCRKAAEMTDEPDPVDIHWILVQTIPSMDDDACDDNATYRLNSDGVAEYWATGVEV